MGKFKSFCYLFMDTLFIHGKSEIYDFVRDFLFHEKRKKGFVGHTRWAAHTPKWQNRYPPYGPFLHTHPKNVTLLGGPSNAGKRVGRADRRAATAKSNP